MKFLKKIFGIQDTKYFVYQYFSPFYGQKVVIFSDEKNQKEKPKNLFFVGEFDNKKKALKNGRKISYSTIHIIE